MQLTQTSNLIALRIAFSLDSMLIIEERDIERRQKQWLHSDDTRGEGEMCEGRERESKC